MTSTTELPPAPASSTEAGVTDRRRPGRPEKVSAELLPMLRGTEPTVEIEFDEIDQNAPFRGIVTGVLLSVPVWAGIAYAGSYLLSR